MDTPVNPQTVLPPELNIARVAGTEIRGIIQTEKFTRLMAEINHFVTPVQLDFSIQVSKTGVFLFQGQFAVTVTLTCQRCLSPMNLSLTEKFRWYGVENELEDSPDSLQGWEPVLIQGNCLKLYTTLEDSLLLALPIVSRHPEEECAISPSA